MGRATGGGIGLRLGVVAAKLGKPCSSGGVPTNPARLVKFSPGGAVTEGDPQVGNGEAGGGAWAAPVAGRLRE